MAQKKAYEVENFLKNKPQSYSVILIYGSDKGMVSEYANLFAKNCGVDGKDPFAITKISGEGLDKDSSNLLTDAHTVALFGGKRLIWISYSGSGNKSSFSETLKQILEKSLTDCYILIEAGELKKTAPLRKVIEQSNHSIALPCYSDEGQALQKLINDVLTQFDCTITPDARALLQSSLGNDRLVSRGEIEKLCLYVQNSKQITVEDVKDSISDETALSQDEVVDAVITGDLNAFNPSFNKLIASGTPAFLILFAVMRQFQQLQLLRYEIEVDGKHASHLIAAARPPIFFKRRKTIEYSLSLWTQLKINKAIERLNNSLLESRKNSELGIAIIRQNLLALTIEAARSK